MLVTPDLDTANKVAMHQARESKTAHQIHVLHNAHHDPLYMVTAVHAEKLRIEEQQVVIALDNAQAPV